LIPHSHTDVGWIRTPEEFYSSLNTGRFGFNTKNILDEVYQELMKDPKRTFTYAEIYFFKLWYTKQDLGIQKNVKMLIKQRRLEIV
jgi:hypothetical protein